MALPYQSHPIFHLRKRTIILSLIGIILCVFCSGPFYGGAFFTLAAVLALTSIFCAADLIIYATKKLEHPDDDPKWPEVKFMVGDFVFGVFLQFAYWSAFGSMMYGYGAAPIAAYAALTGFLCSLLHSWCLWKQLMARYKKKWLASLLHQPCARCGYRENAAEPVVAPIQSSEQPHNTFTYAGPSAEFRRANILTPESPESAMEEGLLIGSDYEASYGSVEPLDPVIDQPQETVVSKGKKNKTTGKTAMKVPDNKTSSGGSA